MPIFSINNDQNISRVCPKMSDEFTHQNNAKLTNCTDAVDYFDELNNTEEEIENTKASYDHMYASNDDNDEIDVNVESCQNTESEVKFLKEWLILHLDLIQQQNHEILDKERTILILQQENEMLKERLNCMERGTSYQPDKRFDIKRQADYIGEHFTEDMTQDSGPFEEDNKANIQLLGINCDNGENCGLDLINFKNKLSDKESLSKHNSKTDSNTYNIEIHENYKPNDFLVNNFSESFKQNCEVPQRNSIVNYNFSIENCSDLDSMRNLRMSIRRKRVYSNSSAFSNNDSLTDEKRSYRKFKKKRRRIMKSLQIVTTPQSYVTQVGDNKAPVSPDPELTNEYSNLEVPRWRIKLYGSCYTMEGTENLDDEVFNKRHARLEIDERRRKRWDVQRIREQRVIEKLKLRQERVGSGAKNDEQNESLNSFWPETNDIQCLEIVDELPVSAFGSPIPNLDLTGPIEQQESWIPNTQPLISNFEPPTNLLDSSDFFIPWINNPAFITKHVSNKRSMVKRKSSRR